MKIKRRNQHFRFPENGDLRSRKINAGGNSWPVWHLNILLERPNLNNFVLDHFLQIDRSLSIEALKEEFKPIVLEETVHERRENKTLMCLCVQLISLKFSRIIKVNIF